MVRVAKALFIVAAVGCLLGVGALVGSLGPSGWSELSDGFVWYLLGRWPLQVLAPLGGLCVLMALVLALVVRKARARLNEVGGGRTGAGPGDGGQELDREQLVQRARHALDKELARSKPQLEQVTDVLLGVPVDLGATGLSLTPAGAGEGAPSAVQVALELGDIQLPVTTMRPALYDEVLQELRQMARVGEAGEGVVKLHASRRLDRLRVALTHQTAGINTRIEVLGESVSEAPPQGRRRSNSVVFRLEPALRDIRTGELQVPQMEENDTTDPSSGAITGLDQSAEQEVAPVVEPGEGPDRAVGRLEAGVRLALASLVTLLVVFFFWNAYAWTVSKIFTGGASSWRLVSLRIESSPVPGEVSIQGEPRGRTPLDTRSPCRGRAIKILVQAPGYATWQWNGVCPEQGRLKLQARLRPLR
jgi:hypothetical protein